MPSSPIDAEYIVVGNGLFGSAAARHLSEESSEVMVIGPDEPDDQLTHDGVFSSHYDARRIARILGRSRIRSEIGRQAIYNYRRIEEASGVTFHEPTGCVIVNSEDVADNNLESSLDVMAALDIDHTFFPQGDTSWQAAFPHFNLPPTHWVLHEPAPSGMIDPRAMLRAQNVIAEQQGASIIRDIVVNVQDSGDAVQVETQSGQVYRAAKVLVTVGSFTNCFDLFPNELPLTPETETIVLGRVSEAEAKRLEGMPTLSYYIDDPVIRDIYMTPAVQYPDGEFYIKMGANTPSDYNPTTLDDLQLWFREGDSDRHLDAMEQALRSILPGVDFLSVESKRCIITRTPNAYPTIDRVTDRTFVASGAHGAGAKSADTLGRMAAGLTIDGRWPPGIPRELFQID